MRRIRRTISCRLPEQSTPGLLRAMSGWQTAIEAGRPIDVRYDPLLAKLIAHGPDRETACRKLVRALEATEIFGVKTNRDYLIQLLGPQARGGAPARHLVRSRGPALYLEQTTPRPLPGVPPNYRNNPYRDPSIKLRVHNEELAVDWKQLTPTGVG